jgi:hypothetical protein
MRGDRIEIDVRMKYSGTGAEKCFTDRFNAAIERQWTGEFGKYDVTTRVTTVTDPTNAIEIEVTAGDFGTYMKAVGSAQGNWFSGEALNDWTAGHEVGHTFGLPDRYANELINGRLVSIPEPGYHGNIMAQRGGVVCEQDIRNIVEYTVSFGIEKPPGAR